ncbi:hypothetical protein CI105_01265 [Candidatus Izimaplasma bacterium ZiA1]|jgi:hypothetical protein|uniref:hypothetical protein n=1 Tax=Candidatus Izimoplasma sp. ZiA1 TaxID=2024899 RepID=UPI000BAA71C6|nr:hypothetical protein CI105_01265 [Candidatus Izimaplasma bacterium ZiA1]
MSFTWASKKPKDGVATLYESNITLNKSASSHFDHAYSVLLGLDEGGKRVAVKPVSKEEYQLGTVPEEKSHKITVKPSYARVCNKKFLKDVADLIKLDLSDNKSYKFRAIWSAKDHALIIDLNEKEE